MNPLDCYHIKAVHERIAEGKNPCSSVNLMEVNGKNTVLEYFDRMERKDSALV